MHIGTEARPPAVGCRAGSCRRVPATASAVTRVKDRKRGCVLLDRPDEARVVSDVDEPAAAPEQASRLRYEPGEVVHVGVSECREPGIERRVLEWHRGGVGVYELRAVCNSGREPKLVDGDVDAGDLPAQIRRDEKVPARPAAEIDAAARSDSQ